MSSKAAPAGIHILRDEKTGREYKVAVGPVQRIEWLADLQDSGAPPAIINLGLAVTRRINGKCGHTFAGDEEIGKLAGIGERAARLYLATLIKQGRLVRIRRGRVPSALYLVMHDRRETCRSKDEHDRKTSCRSKNTSTGKDTTFDRKRCDTSTGKRDFASASNQTDCGPITQRITQRSNSANNAREKTATDFSQKKDAKKQPHSRVKKSEIDELFERRFWTVWPNKVGKPAARKAFEACWRDIDAIADGVDRYIATKPPERQWLNPSTFLNQRRWEDEPAQAVVSANGGPSPGRRRSPDDIWEIAGLVDPYKSGGH